MKEIVIQDSSSFYTLPSINWVFNCVNYLDVAAKHAGNLNVPLKCGDNNLKVATKMRTQCCNNYFKIRGNNSQRLVSLSSTAIRPYNSFALPKLLSIRS